MTGWEAPASLESGPGLFLPCNLPPLDKEGGVMEEKMRWMTGKMKLSLRYELKQKDWKCCRTGLTIEKNYIFNSQR